MTSDSWRVATTGLDTALLLWKGGFNIMSQFLTINKLSGHVFVNQGVFVVKVIINFNNIIKLSNVIFLIMKITVPETSTDTGETLSLTTNALSPCHHDHQEATAGF